MGKLGRGVSNVIAEALLLLVGVSLAALLSSAIISRMSYFQSRFSAAVSEMSQAISERLAYVYGTYVQSERAFVVYLKNVGDHPVYEVDKSTILFGSRGSLQYIPYCSVQQSADCWKLTEFGVVNGVVDPAETVAIYIYNSTSLEPPYRFKLVTPRGSSVEAEFSTYP